MQPQHMLDLKEGTRVKVRPMAFGGASDLPITGTVRGIATNPVAVIGRSVIIEPDDRVGEFSCIAVFEVHLFPLKD